MPIISIVIPVYKTEKYLRKCIDSVLAQSFTDFELLLIDDGSPDHCGVICDEYTQKDHRVHAVHTENHGVSAARNKGIERASGDYLLFIDSDDYIEIDMVTTLYGQLTESEVDLSVCGYIIENESGEVIYQVDEKIGYTEDKWETILTLFKSRYYKYQGYLFNKLFKSEIIKTNALQFNDQIYYNEDRLFVFQYAMYINKTVYTTAAKYHYLIREQSAMGDLHQHPLNFRRHLTFSNAYELMGKEKTLPSFIRREWANNYIKDLIECYKRNNACHITEYNPLLKSLVRKHLFVTSRNQITYILFAISPTLYTFLTSRYIKKILPH